MEKSNICSCCGYNSNKKRNILIILASVITVILVVSAFFAIKSLNSNKIDDLSENYFSFSEGFTDVLITDEKSAIEAVNSVADIIGVKVAEEELRVVGVSSVEGDNYYRMQQYYSDIPVYGKTIIVAADENGQALALTSNFRGINKDIDLEPKATDEKLAKSVQNYFKTEVTDLYFGYDDLVLCETENNKLILAYEIETCGNRVIIDANTAEILMVTSLYSQDVVECYYKDGKKDVKFMGTKASDEEYLIGDEEKGIFIFNANCKETMEQVKVDGIVKYRSIPEKVFLMKSTDNCFGNNDEYAPKEYAKAVYMMQSLNYISDYFKRIDSSFDSAAVAVLNDGTDPDNATGGYLSVDGITNEQFPYDKERIKAVYFGANYSEDIYGHLDTLGHEYTHSVIKSNLLVDAKESSAINEGYADALGELLEYYEKCNDENLTNVSVNWIHGDRDMVCPSKYGYPTSIKDLEDVETFMKEGVLYYVTEKNKKGNEGADYAHYASTIISHCAYLMWNGIDGTEENQIDEDKLGELLYRSIKIMVDNPSFKQCRNAVELSARIMLRNGELTDVQYRTVLVAFDCVGIENECFTYSETVKNKFDLSVLNRNGSEYINYKLEVIKVIPKIGPDKMKVVLENTSFTGKQTLALKNGTYMLRVTDASGVEDDVQSISIKLVVAGNDMDATDEVVVYTDFADIITVILDESDTEQNSELVIDARNETYIYDEDVCNQVTGAGHYVIPKIMLSSPDVERVNEEILNNYAGAFNFEEALPKYRSLNYEYYVNGNILSVIITAEHHYDDQKYYSVYSFDINTKKQLNNDDIADIYGIAYSDVEREVVNQMYENLEEFSEYLDQNQLEIYKKRCISEENLSNINLYIANDNQLMAVYHYFIPAAGEKFYGIMPIKKGGNEKANNGDNSLLTESVAEELASQYGYVAVLKYADYDDNGTFEAFAIIKSGKEYGDTIKKVIFISSEKDVINMTDFSDYHMLLNKYNDVQYCDNKGFFSFNTGGGASYSENRIYSVKDNKPYELDISGEYCGFDKEGDIFYVLESEYRQEGGKVYNKIELIYDAKNQQFKVGEDNSLDSFPIAVTPYNFYEFGDLAVALQFQNDSRFFFCDGYGKSVDDLKNAKILSFPKMDGSLMHYGIKEYDDDGYTLQDAGMNGFTVRDHTSFNMQLNIYNSGVVPLYHIEAYNNVSGIITLDSSTYASSVNLVPCSMIDWSTVEVVTLDRVTGYVFELKK